MGSVLLRIPDVAAKLSVSRSEVYRLIALGRLPAVRLSERVLRVPAEAIEALVADAMSGSGGDKR
jgi:excisionase family DNA binding protein